MPYADAKYPPKPCPYVTGTVTKYCTLTPFTLTDAERNALWFAVAYAANGGNANAESVLRGLQSALRGLLERLG